VVFLPFLVNGMALVLVRLIRRADERKPKFPPHYPRRYQPNCRHANRYRLAVH